jgi:hypothetical protein
LDGHRQVYCERWASVLLARGFQVCLAASFTGMDARALLPEFTAMLDRPGVSRADVSCFPAAGLDIGAAELAGLVGRVEAGITVLLEADDLLPAMSGQIGRGARLPGRRVGLFIRSTNYVYPGRRPLRTELGWLRRLPAEWREWPRLFHESLLPRHKLLDAALCLDEYFVATHQRTHHWIPDIFQTSSQADRPVGSPAGCEEGDGRLLAARLRAFTDDHAGRELFVYFGTAYARRGYDTLLSLAVRRGGCFIHCGRRHDGDSFSGDIVALRGELERRGDLFETRSFVADFAAADLCLSVPPAIVLPYRHHLGSSGVMLQALRVGRPVLVPAEGLIGRRVRDHGLGAVYDQRDREALDRGVALLWARSPEQFAVPITRFLRRFSRDQVERAILGAVEGEPDGWGLPAEGLGAGLRPPAGSRLDENGVA